jgi:hypothetical protein
MYRLLTCVNVLEIWVSWSQTLSAVGVPVHPLIPVVEDGVPCDPLGVERWQGC